MSETATVVADLIAEGDELAAILASLADSDWTRQTPAPGWTIAHQVAHLAMTDTASIVSAASGVGPRELAKSINRRQVSSLRDIVVPSVSGLVRPRRGGAAGLIDRAANHGAGRKPADLLEHWQQGRHALADALSRVPDEKKLRWIGPPMRPATMAAARLMETFAHGQDILDTLGIGRVATSRLRHVAGLGVRTRRYAYGLHKLSVPPAPRVQLVGPDGSAWTWGPEDAADTVTGSALDFCFLVTQRRHLEDCADVATGEGAQQWLEIAQAFAGPPGEGRAARRFDTRG
jgi:uncharacterized protein (TIGR03084 family)